jgi:cytochrome c553
MLAASFNPCWSPTVSLRRIVTTAWLVLLALAAPFGRAVQVPDTLEQRLLACAVCHGKLGQGTTKSEIYPRLAGKPEGYLYNQLTNFRNMRRRYAVMNYMVSTLSEAYLREIAQYYAELRAPYPPPATGTPPAVLALGESLVMRGDPARHLPACVECHGKSLAGLAPAIPGLIGLSPAYIGQEMGAWKSGHRRAAAPDCMARIASKLELAEISAIAAWLAAQPGPRGSAPSLPSHIKLPLECGSMAQR